MGAVFPPIAWLDTSLLEQGTGEGGSDNIGGGLMSWFSAVILASSWSYSDAWGLGDTAGVDWMELTRVLLDWSMFCIKALNSGVSSSSLETTNWTSLSQARADWRASTVSTVMGC